jgi:hypothetical protein
MAESVRAGYTPVDADPSDELWLKIEDWITNADLIQLPVFCGRSDVLATFPRLFENPGATRGTANGRQRVLAILVDDDNPGYGRTRLLKELAAQAFRDGHLPVLLQFEGQDVPHDHRQFVRALDMAITRLRNDVLCIDEVGDSQLQLLDGGQEDDHKRLAPEVKRVMGRDGALTEEALRRALQLDLGALLEAAYEKEGFFRAAKGQVVVLLDDVDQYGELTARLFATPNGLLRATGFGTAKNPVPVVMTCSRQRTTATESPVLRLYEKPWSIPWLAVHKLGELGRDGEDLLACQAVLLNPFARSVLPKFSDVAWAFNGDIDAATRQRYERRFRKALGGMPCQFESGGFFAVTRPASKAEFLVPVDDDRLMAALPKAI